MKAKRLKHLWWQFGHLAPDLSASEIAGRLESVGLITIEKDGAKYRETAKLREVPKQDFDSTIAEALKGGHNA